MAGERRIGEQFVDRAENSQVAVAVQGRERPRPRLGSAAGEATGQLGAHRAEHQLIGQPREQLLEPGEHHLGVPGRGKLTRQPRQLTDQPTGAVAVEHRAKACNALRMRRAATRI